jgi:hypothetical protein
MTITKRRGGLKLNPCPPYRDALDASVLPLTERRKLAVAILIQVLNGSAEKFAKPRAIRKACNITGRQYRKARLEAKATR